MKLSLTTRLIALVLTVMAVACTAQAAPYYFTSGNDSSKWIDVDYWTGTGTSETILIVDWNNAGDWVSESHAFGYRWDGSATTEAAMLADICANGGLDIDTGYGGAFVNNLFYTDADGDVHAHTEEGSWNLGSTNDVNAVWGDMNGDWTKLGDWDANGMGIDSEYIADGQLEGINLMWWFSPNPIQPLTVPVPEPATIGLLAMGLAGVLGRKYRK
jgi:hypothetical protein